MTDLHVISTGLWINQEFRISIFGKSGPTCTPLSPGAHHWQDLCFLCCPSHLALRLPASEVALLEVVHVRRVHRPEVPLPVRTSARLEEQEDHFHSQCYGPKGHTSSELVFAPKWANELLHFSTVSVMGLGTHTSSELALVLDRVDELLHFFCKGFQGLWRMPRGMWALTLDHSEGIQDVGQEAVSVATNVCALSFTCTGIWTTNWANFLSSLFLLRNSRRTSCKYHQTPVFEHSVTAALQQQQQSRGGATTKDSSDMRTNRPQRAKWAKNHMCVCWNFQFI